MDVFPQILPLNSLCSFISQMKTAVPFKASDSTQYTLQVLFLPWCFSLPFGPWMIIAQLLVGPG